MLLRNIFESIARTGQGKTAVVGWGRGMGHKGHMMLASSVITQASKVGGDPYFVVSKTVGKDDPITPDEKISIYKKVFPQSGHIFQPATDEIPDLTRVLANLNQQGYTSVTVVLGADQVKAFQYLKNYNNKPDKTGNILYSFDNLDVISRQETGDPSAGEEGPRATPMRQVLTDPSKSEQEQFAVWRDAMSPEVSDDEVRDLMAKAKQRMSDPAFGKKPKVKEVKTTAAVKLGKAWDQQKQKSDASRERAAQAKAEFEKQWAEKQKNVSEKMMPASNFSGSKKNKLGTAGQWRNDGPSKNRPARSGDLVGGASESIEEGFGSKLAGLGLAGALALGGGHAQAGQDLGNFATDYLQKVASGDHPRPMVSIDDAKAELQLRANGKQQSVTPEPSNSKSGFSKEWLQKAADPNRTGRYMISVEKAQELLSKMNAVDEAKKKGVDGKACWDGYRYNGTENGSDKCVKVSEDVQDIMDALINKIIVNEAIQNNRR